MFSHQELHPEFFHGHNNFLHFFLDQVKPAGQDDAPKAKTPEEIAAYNKKLADERKARKAAQQAAAAPAPAQPAAECEQISMF